MIAKASTITINNKKYRTPEFTFRDIKELEAKGFSLIKFVNPEENSLSMLSALVAVTAQVDEEEADRLIEQHIYGGGNPYDLLKQLMSALAASPFFKKMLENMSKGQEKTEKSQKLSEASETIHPTQN